MVILEESREEEEKIWIVILINEALLVYSEIDMMNFMYFEGLGASLVAQMVKNLSAM